VCPRVHVGVKRGTMALLLVMAATALACQPPADDDDGTMLTGLVLAGPTCPVERDPPDPACDERPVEGAEIVIVDVRGDEVARTRTDAAGTFAVRLPAGEYQLVPQPVEGLLGTPGPTAIAVEDGVDLDPVTIVYDTGIR
jgi:hypothetical protein